MSANNLSLTSLILAVIVLVAIYYWYEKRRTSPAEIAILATLAALAGLGRVPFAAIPVFSLLPLWC